MDVRGKKIGKKDVSEISEEVRGEEEMKILVTVPFREKHREQLRAAAADAAFFFPETYTAEGRTDQKKYEELLREADIVIGNPTIEEICSAPHLKFVQSSNAGIERYTQVPGFPKDVLLCSMSGAFGGIISEYILAGILTMYRRFPKYIGYQKKRLWQDAGSEQSLMGKTALILGVGDIGTNTAKRLKAFDVHTIGIRRTKKEASEWFDETATTDELDQMLSRADIVVGCVPKTTQTVHLLNEERLRKIKKDGLIVNVGRGSLIVQPDLVKVLKDGHLMGAVLDVTDPEPLPEDDELWSMKNVLITPHVSGISFGHAPQVEDNVAKICSDNLKAFLNHTEMVNVVDWQSGYRKR